MRPYPVIDPKATGENIRARRLAAGYTIPELQAYFGFADVQAIYRWQNGTNLPTLENMYALSTLLGITVNELVAERKQL